MKTKFDIGEDVLIQGRVKSIAITEKGEIGYKVTTKSGDVLVLDEDEIVKVSQDKIDTETPEAMKTCGRCKYETDSTSDISSPCYMCYRNPDDFRLPDNWIKDE